MNLGDTETAWWRRWALIAAACLAFSGATRWPLAPLRHLYHIDNVSFALALDDFNPALGQPQPPGDPLYVALTRWMRPFVPSVELLFPLSGVLGSAAAMTALWWVAEMMFGARAGALAALLLGLNPIFWLAGVGNYVRVYLALGAAVVAGLAWRSLSESSRLKRGVFFCGSAAALGLFAGFRPELGVLLAPLVFLAPRFCVASSFCVSPSSCVERERASAWMSAVAVACWAGATAPWLLITAHAAGGLAALYHLNRDYLAIQSRHTAWVYGASLAEGFRMAGASVYWHLLSAAPWAAFAPFIRGGGMGKQQTRFLVLWFIPPFLFYTFIHIHNPDHALVSISALCVVGGWALTRLPAVWFWGAAPAALVLSVVLFFYPTGSPFWASNYRIAEYTIRSGEQVYARVGLLEETGAVTVLWDGAYITPQEIGYYFPNVPILDLQDEPAQVRLGNRYQPAPAEAGDILIRSGKVLWLDPVNASRAGIFDDLRKATGGELGSEGAVHWANIQTGARFRVGGRWIKVVDATANPPAGIPLADRGAR